MKIAIAVSGGVDSLYALISLKEAGHDVAALHARFMPVPKDKDPVPLLSTLCKEWGIPLHIVDLKEDFTKYVIRPFLESYARSETPNPCAHCNKSMKFGRLLDIARNLSVASLATGHYVNMEDYFLGANKTISYGLCLKSAHDSSKDQSYFLALTPIEKLRFAQFPLANKLKKDIVEELRLKNITIPIQKESQEVCFVPNDNYREFIEMQREKRQINYQGEGDIVFRNDNVSKKIGMHNGLWRYTEGQRKGLGIAWSDPLYVIEKNEEKNILYVGTRSFLDISSAYAFQINFLVAPEYWNMQSNFLEFAQLAQEEDAQVTPLQKDILKKQENKIKQDIEKQQEEVGLFVRTRFREKPSPARVFLEIPKQHNLEISTESQYLKIELGTKESYSLLKDFMKQSVDLQLFVPELGINNNYDNKYLWHVQEEETRFESEEEKAYSLERQFWNTMPVRLVVEFLSPKQVYAKGQVLAVYDKKGFLLAGGILL